MRWIVLALASSGCVGNGRRVQTERDVGASWRRREQDESASVLHAVADIHRSGDMPAPRGMLSRMLLALEPAKAFNSVFRNRPSSHRLHVRSPPPMMPLGYPKVPYRMPGGGNYGAEWVDIFDRLNRDRIIFLGGQVDDSTVNKIIALMLFLSSEAPDKPIYLYINSPGGSVSAGLSLYDAMQHVKAPVITCNIGLAASMGSFILGAGEKGKRLAMPHSRIMLHQTAVASAIRGQAEDIKVTATQVKKYNDLLINSYAEMTGHPPEKIRADLDRDNFMSAQEALEYGLIDRIIKPPTEKGPGPKYRR